MATVTKRPNAAPPEPVQGRAPWPLRAVDSVYRFLASLKLAVISLSTLAATLSYATFFESKYGTAAVQEWIYRSKGFAILLAFLGANILCAALIRYPWKRRQTGFVVTHAGLLIVLAGAWYSVMTADEGQVAFLEGEAKDELVRNDYPVIRVRQVRTDPNDPHKAPEVEREWELPFRPGSFEWGPGKPKPRSILEAVSPANLLRKDDARNPVEVLTRPKDPFQVVVKEYLPASIPAVKHVADPSGAPMVKIRPLMKAPGMPQARDVFHDDEERWFESDRRIYKVVRNEGPAQFAFLYVDRPELVDDFLNPPADSGNDGVARFRYADSAGKTRVYDWKLDGQSGQTVRLPDSDLSVKFLDLIAFPAAEAGLSGMLGSTTVPIAEFEVTNWTEASVKDRLRAIAAKPSTSEADRAALDRLAEDDPAVWGASIGAYLAKSTLPADDQESVAKLAPVKHFALAGLPMFPNVIPNSQKPGGAPPRPLVSVTYDLPPLLDVKGGGRFGVVEVLGTPEGATYYRVWGRPEAGKPRSQLRAKGPIKTGQSVVAFGGNPNMPMTLSFEVEQYLTGGARKDICEPVVLPKGQMGNGIPACLVEMTVKDGDHEDTREFYVRRSNTLDQVWKPVTFHDGPTTYEIAFDVDRKPLGFELKLVDFQRGFDPGTEQASRFSSDVRITDKGQGLDNKPYRIYMNHPLTHRGYTFYQSSYIREEDPRTGRETGRVQSVLQVASNPGGPTIYLGCALVVLGTFIQFYMRAGVFTDGGKRERERAAGGPAAKGEAKRRPADETL